MNLTLTVLEITAPVFLLAAVGFAWVTFGIEYRIQFVTRMAMTLAVPCLIFVSLMQTEMDPTALTQLSLATILAYVGVTAVTWALTLGLGLDRRTYLAPLIFGNTGNLGLPLALFAFGGCGAEQRDRGLCDHGGVVVHVRDLAGFRQRVSVQGFGRTDGRRNSARSIVLVAGLGNPDLCHQHIVVDRANGDSVDVDHTRGWPLPALPLKGYCARPHCPL